MDVERHQPGRGIQQDGVTCRTCLPAQNSTDDGGICRGVAATKLLHRCGTDSQNLRIERLLDHFTVPDLPDSRRPGRCHLIQAVASPEDQSAAAALGQHAGNQRRHPGVGHANRRGLNPCRVGQRAQEVERRGDGKFSPGYRCVPKRRMEHLGEAEGDARLFGVSGHAINGKVQSDAERLQHIR
jgi:hypothetical protein